MKIRYILKESREENLKKKYSSKFSEDLLNLLLSLPLLKETNHKYSDFLLKVIDPESRVIDQDIQDVLSTISDFHRFQTSLAQKDINQYKTLEELKYALIIPKTKFKEKELEKEVDKIYEDSDFLVLIPKSQDATCKYGSNTKWCVTQRDTGHFENYTRGNQVLYFFINKKNSTDEEYSKVAIHFDNNSVPTYYDSKDKVLSDREIRFLNFAFPEVMGKIREDYKIRSSSQIKLFLKSVFDSETKGISKEFMYFNYTNQDVKIYVGNFSLVDTDQARGYATIYSKDHNEKDYKKIDNYILEISFSEYSPSIIHIETHYVPAYVGENYVDFGLEKKVYKDVFGLEKTVDDTIKKIQARIISDMVRLIWDHQPFLEKYRSEKIWFPNKNYGYTFKQNKGLIKKLVDWLDSGQNGTKLDFLQSIGKIRKKMIDNKPYFKRPTDSPTAPWKSQNEMRGQYSSFFGSAKDAGIIDYQKRGNKFLIVKGKNFEDFKKGELRSV